jgi:hypothetical protein
MSLLAAPYDLKTLVADRWVRFHCLPESKRYAENESEYAIILDRYNTVLGELFGDRGVYIVEVKYHWEPESPGPRQAWRTLITDDDPEFGESYTHLFVNRRKWRRGVMDEALRRVADFEDAGGVITDLDARWLFHPYDGGMDVIAPSVADRDALRDRHRNWLSKHPQGY